MKALILAAGLGTRMRPLTDHCPKPLLAVGDHKLIEYHLYRLAAIGVTEVIINTAYLAEQIEDYLADGERYGLTIHYSQEGMPLETGGAIRHALPLLGDQPFLLINGDVYCEYPLTSLLDQDPEFAHLLLVPNPEFKQQGDFGCVDGLLTNQADELYTYAGIGVYQPSFFQQYQTQSSFPLAPIIRQQADAKRVTAELYNGVWMDIGTPQRLETLSQYLAQKGFNI
ncbi:MAG: nucleotidyltransferase family protein [Kangiellaceae bacterium]|jgi:MurNAc alpha-1-phosphate uridylyltransferase|nr:nucleotidyltransferase family protein [Kangiellaceae bacterium]